MLLWSNAELGIQLSEISNPSSTHGFDIILIAVATPRLDPPRAFMSRILTGGLDKGARLVRGTPPRVGTWCI